MKFQDIINEATEYDVEVSDDLRFKNKHENSFGYHYKSYMMRKEGRLWVGLTKDSKNNTVRFEGSKAKVASWCLSVAVDGL